MMLTARNREIRFPRRPLVMGIVNLSPDSFSGDGRSCTSEALDHASRLISDGADIIDVGGETARTGQPPIGEQEEVDRLLPFVDAFCRRSGAGDFEYRDEMQLQPPMLSINTWRGKVADGVLASGGDLYNDISGLPEPMNAEVAARHGVALVIMHTVGLPKRNHTHVRYDCVMEDLERFFRDKIDLAVSAGLPLEATVLDPGIDFAKSAETSLQVYRELERLNCFERPVLLPVSRKEVIGEVLGQSAPNKRDPGTIACVVRGFTAGAAIVRVHNVRAAAQAIRILSALEAPENGE